MMYAPFIALFFMLTKPAPGVGTTEAKALHVLNNTLKQKPSWIKVHAAEYLIALGYTEAAFDEFLREEKMHAKEAPYRIGIWRVLARADQHSPQKWIDRISAVYRKKDSPDRLHAVETLAKLGVPADRLFAETAAQDLRSADARMRLYTTWATTNSSNTKQQNSNNVFIGLALHNSDPVIQKISAYVLRYRNNLTPAQWNSLFNGQTGLANRQELGLTLRATLLSTVPATIADRRINQLKSQLMADADGQTIPQQTEICLCLAEKGDKNSIPFLGRMLEKKPATETEATADLHSAAAYAILKINARK